MTRPKKQGASAKGSKRSNPIKAAARIQVKSDGLVKRIMVNEIVAREFLEESLTPEFKELIDLSQIKVEQESFVEDDLKRRLSDILYSVRTKGGDEAFVYCLIEHATGSDYWLALKLWKYVLLLCERHIKKKDKLPLIAPVVIYVRHEVVLCFVINKENGGKKKKLDNLMFCH